MAFNIPKQHDDFFYIQFFLIFIMSILYNFGTNGQQTINLLNNSCGITPTQNINILDNFTTQDYKDLQKYDNQISYRNKRILYINEFLYWILSPLINFYFAFFVFKKGQFNKNILNNNA